MSFRQRMMDEAIEREVQAAVDRIIASIDVHLDLPDGRHVVVDLQGAPMVTESGRVIITADMSRARWS